jgi:hypothetical protein
MLRLANQSYDRDWRNILCSCDENLHDSTLCTITLSIKTLTIAGQLEKQFTQKQNE